MPKIEYTFNPLDEIDEKLSREQRDEALERVAVYVKEAMLDYIGEGKSPVQGGLWKRSLTPAYKKRKSSDSSALFANLELSGDLLDALDVEVARGGKIRVSVADSQAGKAEGNLIGSYGRDPDPFKAREFMPQGEQSFKGKILDGIREILEDVRDGDAEA